MAHHIAQLIPQSYSAISTPNRYYKFNYDWQAPSAKNPVLAEAIAAVLGPVMLGRLMNRAHGFLYLGELGFLSVNRHNFREFEFKFLTSHGCKLVCYFVGSDIRSLRLLRNLEKQTGLVSLGTQLPLSDPVFGTEAHEQSKQRVAAVAEEYADAIFSSSVDQLSYLTRPTHPITYFYPDEDFQRDDSKFDNLNPIVVVHAPSSPIIKGTELVREAVERLHSEGYEFEYVELMNTPNEVVRKELARAHIVLNQFYAYIPGVFGIEGLASNCAVLMSADETIEPDLPAGSNDAWVVTKHFEVYEKLKHLLDHPDTISSQAARGQAWATEHVSLSHAGPRLLAILDQILDSEEQ